MHFSCMAKFPERRRPASDHDPGRCHSEKTLPRCLASCGVTGGIARGRGRKPLPPRGGDSPQPWGPMGCVLCYTGQRHEWGWHVSSYLQRGARGPGLVLLGGDAEL